MSRKEREMWQAMLDADPALREAWDGFRGTLARVSDQIVDRGKPDIAALREAALRVRAEAGEDQTHH